MDGSGDMEPKDGDGAEEHKEAEEESPSSEDMKVVDVMVSYLRDVGGIELIDKDEEIRCGRIIAASREKIRSVLIGNTPMTEALNKPGASLEDVVRITLDTTNIDDEARVEITGALTDYLVARNVLITANQRLVVAVAKKYNRGAGVYLADLIQEGNLGLMRAADKYDPEMGNRFSTYATWWIRQTVIKASRRGKVVRVAPSVRENMNLAKGAIHRLMHREGRKPTIGEIAAEAGMNAQKTHRTMQDIYAEGEGGELLESMEDPNVIGPDRQVEIGELRSDIHLLLSSLPEEEAQVLGMKFGCGDYGESSLEEISAAMKLSVADVKKLEMAALCRIRGSREIVNLMSYFR